MSRAQLHFVIALVVFVAAGIGYWVAYGAVAAQSAQVASLTVQIAAKKDSLTRAASMHATLDTLSGEEATISQYFVSESTIVDFISALQAQGQRLGGAITVSSVSADTKSARPTLTLALVIDGTFDAVLRTIGTIENAPYDTQTTSLSLLNKGKNAWEAQLGITVGSVPGGVQAGPAPSHPSATLQSSHSTVAPIGPAPSHN